MKFFKKENKNYPIKRSPAMHNIAGILKKDAGHAPQNYNEPTIKNTGNNENYR